MLPSDHSHLTPSQVDDLRRKLDACGCHPPPQARSISELADAFATLRRRNGLPPSNTIDADTLRCLEAGAGVLFNEVLRDELDMLRPVPGDDPGDDPDAGLPPDRARLLGRVHGGMLTGLAISGGGMRSATFGLGALQALAAHGLLRRIDYISTVSGGGFIGGWLSKCLHAHGGDIGKVEALLAPGAGGSEAPEVRFLRQHSNYLSPQGGMFSADTWTLLGTYVRNTGLNLSMLVAWMCALLLLPRFAVWAVNRVVAPGGPWAGWGDIAWIAGVLLFLFAVFCIALSISSKPESSQGLRRFPLSQGAVLWCINLPLLLAGFLGSVGLWRHGGALGALGSGLPLPAQLQDRPYWLLAPGVVYFIVWACGWYLAYDRASHYRRAGYAICGAGFAAVALLLVESGRAFAPEIVPGGAVNGERLSQLLCGAVALLLITALALALHTRMRASPPLRDLTRAEVGEGFSHFICAMGALTLGTVLLLTGLALLPDPATHPVFNNAIALASFGMPLMMALFGATMTLMIGLIGRLYSDASREWWSRQGAWATILALGWLAVYGVSFFCAPLLHWAWLTYAPWSNLGTLAGWLAMTAFGLKAGSGTGTGTGAGGGARTASSARLDLAARLAPYVFTLGIVALLSSLVQAVVALPSVHCPGNALACVYEAHARATLATDGSTLALAFAGFLGAALLLGWRVDINKFSLYMLYRNRIVRAFFGASNRARRPHPFTGFDPADDVLLSDLRYQRPYPIVNTSLNFVGGEELAWQTRRTASFAFTPRWCGYELSSAPGVNSGCYRPTDEYASRAGVGGSDDDTGVRLGMAVALSGAAASPNMGAHSSAPLNFLMTMFNVRLGRWCPNPQRNTWTSASPPIGLFSLLAELFGQADADAGYVHLSDGGHFDNLGIYELVRRRCKLVIALDVGSDRQLAFEDLGNTIRRCGTDLHVRIDLDVSRLDAASNGLCGASCAAGRIRYSLADRGATDGVILYIKPAIVGSENADLLNYRRLHPDYPHESIADQWFDEAQFESYRALGCHIVDCALGEAARQARRPGGEHDIARLCAQLLERGTTTATPNGAGGH
ncbi:patatin-like phospholipase family protein [Massilia sp.]|uniref:patatin-like phospholipase family protein n=1 Tax=Massilia sp. TaxID=1882437 RepID=UPI00289B8F46|nr:patatin-like phospholipase family protein [Massilia sp.]